ncbi:mRNA N(3)-methylcytidine methyltransferase METTL8 [Mugil cephalus]|uniref:mRNA N(3)-methylcytidine methyltransferase METTL8 n=1 Tax=Mugil cephalus TaxID=48193 RepID=UPI001FB63C1F|nr:mRNA N(3)-methylcytidine methyltransferase METTL8 [Mugil cephalus]
MHKLQRLSVAKLATVFLKLSVRLKSSTGRPSVPLGARLLTNPDDIFKHNMWDHVEWTEEDRENARRQAAENSSVRLPLTEQGKLDREASQYWDKFYEMHQDKFFKDRKWLFLEFPELLPPGAESQDADTCRSNQPAESPLQGTSSTDAGTRRHRRNTGDVHFQEAGQDAGRGEKEAAEQTSAFPGQHASFRIFEAGCGVGNSVFPILKSIKNTDSFLYCCDFSPRAIQMVKDHPDYDDSVCHAFVHDICEETASFPFPPQSLDVVLAVFVLSAIHPDRLQGVANRLSAYLKPGGIFLFRDRGRYDLSQLRFKKGRCLSENFYTCGDGTCVYFFTKEEVHDLFSKAGLEEIQNLEDRRLQVNRRQKVVMRRVWMQGKFRKPYPPSSS